MDSCNGTIHYYLRSSKRDLTVRVWPLLNSFSPFLILVKASFTSAKCFCMDSYSCRGITTSSTPWVNCLESVTVCLITFLHFLNFVKSIPCGQTCLNAASKPCGGLRCHQDSASGLDKRLKLFEEIRFEGETQRAVDAFHLEFIRLPLEELSIFQG